MPSIAISTIFYFIAFFSGFRFDKSKPVYITKKANIEIDSIQAFQPNVVNGWDTLSTYFAIQNDSVKAELILSKALGSGTELIQTTLVGFLAAPFIPAEQVETYYRDPMRTWLVSIRTDGHFSVRLSEGALPTGPPIIIPIQIMYKK